MYWVNFWLVVATTIFQTRSQMTSICLQGFVTRGTLTLNGPYTQTNPTLWTSPSESTVEAGTHRNVSVWIAKPPLLTGSTAFAAWVRETTDPVGDAKNQASLGGEIKTFENTTDKIGSVANLAVITSTCLDMEIPRETTRFCVQEVGFVFVGIMASGEWKRSNQNRSGVAEFEKVSFDEFLPITWSATFSRFSGNRWTMFARESFDDFELVSSPFVFGDLARNLRMFGVTSEVTGAQLSPASYRVTNGSCPTVDLNRDVCAYALPKFNDSISYIKRQSPFNLTFLQKEIDFLEWFYPMYTFGDIVRNFSSRHLSLAYDIPKSLDDILHAQWDNLLQPLTSLKRLYQQLKDAHLSYNPPSNIAVGIWAQPVQTMFAAIDDVASHKFGIFGKTNARTVEMYEKVFGTFPWVNSSSMFWKIIEIDGVDALSVLQDYADNRFGISHDAGTRLVSMLNSASFSNRRMWPRKSSLSWKVCDPYDCAATTSTYELNWISLVKLTCPSVEERSTASPSQVAPRTMRPTQAPLIPSFNCTVTWTSNSVSQHIDTVSGKEKEEGEEEESRLSVADDALKLTRKQMKELRMGVEDFSGKRSSLRDAHDVVYLAHHDIESISKARRILPHEHDMLSRPTQLVSDLHRDSPNRHNLPPKLAQYFYGSSARGFVYKEGQSISYHVDEQASVLVLHINTFVPFPMDTFRREVNDLILKHMSGQDGVERLALDFTDNGGGFICLGYGFVYYMLGGHDIGWPFVMDTVPNDFPAGTTYRGVTKHLSSEIERVELQGQCANFPCDFIGQMTPCAWGFSDASWMNGGPTVERVHGHPVRLSRRLSWTTICNSEKDTWPESPFGKVIARRNRRNLLLISDGFCGSMCAIVSSYLHSNKFGAQGTYGGLWSNDHVPPSAVDQIFNSFPGGQVAQDATVVQQLLGFSTFERNDSVVQKYMDPVFRHGEFPEGFYSFTFLELYNPLVKSQPNFQGSLPLEFLDELRLAKYRTPLYLSEVAVDGGVTSAITRLYQDWIENSSSDDEDDDDFVPDLSSLLACGETRTGNVSGENLQSFLFLVPLSATVVEVSSCGTSFDSVVFVGGVRLDNVGECTSGNEREAFGVNASATLRPGKIVSIIVATSSPFDVGGAFSLAVNCTCSGREPSCPTPTSRRSKSDDSDAKRSTGSKHKSGRK